METQEAYQFLKLNPDCTNDDMEIAYRSKLRSLRLTEEGLTPEGQAKATEALQVITDDKIQSKIQLPLTEPVVQNTHDTPQVVYQSPVPPSQHSSSTLISSLPAVSLSLAVTSILLGFVSGIPAVILGILGIKKVKNSQQSPKLALVGIILGAVTSAVSILGCVILVVTVLSATKTVSNGFTPSPFGSSSSDKNPTWPSEQEVSAATGFSLNTTGIGGGLSDLSYGKATYATADGKQKVTLAIGTWFDNKTKHTLLDAVDVVSPSKPNSSKENNGITIASGKETATGQTWATAVKQVDSQILLGHCSSTSSASASLTTDQVKCATAALSAIPSSLITKS